MNTFLFCAICGATLTETTSMCSACGSSIMASGATAPPIKQTPLSSISALPASPAPKAPSVLPPGFLLAQRYRILRQLGQGGFATVYQARDRMQRNTMVAIKQIYLETFSLQAMLDATDAYNREVNHLSQLRSPHLPRIVGHFLDEQHWYIVMEYIKGQTLEERLQTTRHGFLPVMQMLTIGIALCDTLHYLHTQQPPLIFRDVKPANIMLTPSGKLYLIDFGTTRLYRPGWKDTGPLGTPGYAAPEQYGKRAHTTPQSDIYSLGATLQTLLTGKEPLEILQRGLPPRFARRVPPQLQNELAHMLAYDALRRPSSIAEVKQALQEIKAQFPSQKAKAACSFVGETFKNTSALTWVALIFLVVVDVASFATMIWQALWMISFLVIAGFTFLSSVLKLRNASQESQIRLSIGEKVSIIWRQLSLSLPVSLLISMVISYLIYLWGSSPVDNHMSVDLITAVAMVGGSIIASLGWAIRQLLIIRSVHRRASQQKQEVLIQKTIRTHR